MSVIPVISNFLLGKQVPCSMRQTLKVCLTAQQRLSLDFVTAVQSKVKVLTVLLNQFPGSCSFFSRRREGCTWRETSRNGALDSCCRLPYLASVHRHKPCGVRGGCWVIMSNRLPPLPPLRLLLFPRLSLCLSQLCPPPPPPSTDIRRGCAIMPKALERNPWQPPSWEPPSHPPQPPPPLNENNHSLLIVDSHKGSYLLGGFSGWGVGLPQGSKTHQGVQI